MTAFKRLMLGQVRARQESYVGLRPVRTAAEEELEARQLLDGLADDVLTLRVNVDALELALEHVAYDASIRAAAASVRSRVAELRAVCEAVSEVQSASESPAAIRLLGQDAPLADYLRGLASWCAGVVRALEQLAVELQRLAPDWGMLRCRLADASEFFVEELARSVRQEVNRLAEEEPSARPKLERLADRLEAVFTATKVLADGLSQPFG